MLLAELGANGQLSLTVRVGNAGSGAMLSDSTVAFYEGDPASGGRLLGTAPVSALSAGAWEDITLSGVTLTGVGSVYGVVDPDNTLIECSEANNSVSATVSTPGVVSVNVNSSTFTSNTPVTVTAVATNNGATAQQYQIRLVVEDMAGVLVADLGAQSVTVASGGSATVTASWNTGSTYAGPYVVRATLLNALGTVSDEQTTPIEILSDAVINAWISTDKQSYQAYDTVRVAVTTQSNGTNSAYSNLNTSLSITDSTGTSIFGDVQSIPYLGPSDTAALGFTWPIAISAPGTYTATVTYTTTSGEVVGQWSVSFTVESSGNTGAGLAGTLASATEIFYQGIPGDFNYTLTNNGNAVMDNVNLRVAFVDQTTTQPVSELPLTSGLSLPINQTVSGAGSVATSGIPVGLYMAALVATVNGVDIGLAMIPVKVEPPPVTTTIDRTNIGRLLVWINDGCHVGASAAKVDCIDTAVVNTTLDRLGKIYHFVYDKKNFQSEMRNGYFTSSLILGRHNPIEGQYGEELRERVYGGKGLVLSPFPGDDNAEELFGITSTGILQPGDRTVHIYGTAPFVEETFPLTVAARKIDLTNSQAVTMILGLFEPVPDTTTTTGVTPPPVTPTPALLSVERGHGAALFFAFDIGAMTNGADAVRFDRLMEAALMVADQTAVETANDPHQYTPIVVTTSSEVPAEAQLTLTIPDAVKVYDNATGEALTSGHVRTVSLVTGQLEDAWTLILESPNLAGTYEIIVHLSVLRGAEWSNFDSQTYTLTVDADITSMTDAIRARLAALVATDQTESVALSKAVNDFNRAITLHASGNLAQAIRYMVLTSEGVAVLSSAEAEALRADLGRLIVVVSTAHYNTPQKKNGK